MKLHSYPPPEQWEKILSRPTAKTKAIKKIVKPIIKAVKRKGDKALYQFAYEYDHVKLHSLLVTPQERVEAARHVSSDLKKAIDTAYKNIKKFHEAQAYKPLKIKTMPGVECRRKAIPIDRVGLYIPGGTAPLFSTVLMLGIPARLAGCRHLVLCTPVRANGRINPVIIYTAHLLGIETIVKVGGAQAIAAMAFGTETVPQVYKIFGPGNQYVTAAKQLLSNRVAIDMPAGPSEVAVLADTSANPAFVAADLLSQAEHGADSQVVLVTPDRSLVDQVMKELASQLEKLPRKDVAKKALSNSQSILVKDVEQGVQVINQYAPEHLIISTQRADQLADQITNAGSVFIGNYTPESAGDYASGTNHTLPTNGYARAFSGVSLDSFMKFITYQKITPQGLKALGPAIEIMAEAEQLVAHKEAVSLRLKAIHGK